MIKKALYPPPAYTPAVQTIPVDNDINNTTIASAEEAIQRMKGAMIGQQAVHLSWGRSPTAKQVECCLPCRPWKCHFWPAHVAENLITLTERIGSYGASILFVGL
ncbi:unnamed protein product [Camellia sinensis]